MEDYVVSDPEIIVKFWPPSITAKGAKAIEAVRKPLAYTLYAKPVVAIAFGLMAVWSGYVGLFRHCGSGDDCLLVALGHYRSMIS
jgi:hypothetical protein